MLRQIFGKLNRNKISASGIEFNNAVQGGGFLHNGRRSILAVIAILTGVIIILSLVLPSQFWWFVLAAGLIAFGVWLNRCR